MIRFVFVGFLAAGLTLPLSAGAQSSPFWGPLQPGKYSAGVDVVAVEDLSRAPASSGAALATTPRGRQIRMAIWYPAKPRDAKRALTLAQLAAQICEKRPTDLETVDQCWPEFKQLLTDSQNAAAATDALARLAALPTASHNRAPHAGRFPVVLFDTGMNGPASFYFSLAEFLASHGYVAVCIPSNGLEPGKPNGFDMRGLETKTLDIAAAINALPRLPYADPAKIALAAWSVGGASAALAQMRSSLVAAFISLDGATTYKYGWDMMQQSPFFDLARATVPHLQFTGKLPNRFNVPRDFSYFEKIQSQEAYSAEVEGFNHSHFFAQGGVLQFAAQQTPAAAEFWSSHAAYSRVLLAFLDAFVKDDAAARALLEKPTAQDASRITLRRRAP